MKQSLTVSVSLDAPNATREPAATTLKSYRIVQRGLPGGALELVDAAAKQQCYGNDIGTIRLGPHGVSLHSRIHHVRLEGSQDKILSSIASCGDDCILMSKSSLGTLNGPSLEFHIADEEPKGKVQVNSSLPGGASNGFVSSQINNELQPNLPNELDMYQTENSLSLEENLRTNHEPQSSPPATPKQHRDLVKDTPATGTRFKQVNQSTETDAEATDDEDGAAAAKPPESFEGPSHSILDDHTMLIGHADGSQSSVHDFSKKHGTLEIPLEAELSAEDDNWASGPSFAAQSHVLDDTGLEEQQAGLFPEDMQDGFLQSHTEDNTANLKPHSPRLPNQAESTGTEKFSTPNEDPEDPNNSHKDPSPRQGNRKRKTTETEDSDIEGCESARVTSSKRRRTSSHSPDNDNSLKSPVSTRNGKKSHKKSTFDEDEPTTPEDTLLDPPVLVFSNSASAEDKVIRSWLRASHATVEKSIDGNNFDILVVSRGEVRRTSKLLMAAALGKRVVTDDWLYDSFKKKVFLSPDSYIIPQQEQWSYDPTDLSRRSSLLSRYTLHITPTLKKEYGDGYKDVEVLAKTVGAAQVISRKVAKKGDNRGVVFMAKDKSDPEVSVIHARGASCFNKDFLSMGVLRGEADVDSAEFMIT